MFVIDETLWHYYQSSKITDKNRQRLEICHIPAAIEYDRPILKSGPL